ncbi:hypothetical protein [Enterobacter ludwigii]|uniref:hypothetical protein n=1 Tax=Enterobacter ludwigii TaxID=299767 RepID=UPI001B369D21|nr:hypothetical protein [Enterobacter ludwigii]MBQ0228435.1 hypothetical protein [Enterobacter ludwigii]
MSNIDKQWLQQKIAGMEEHRDLFPCDLDDDHGNVLSALRIALASLEAEERADPVAFINGAWTLVYYRPPKELGLKIGDKLYTAQPAPLSVPDDVLKGFLPDAEKAEFWFEHNGKILFEGVKFNNAVFDACRAAMLQGAAGNSPVIPDGYTLVPVEPTYQMCEAMDLPWERPRFPDRYKAMLAAAPVQEAK